MTASGALTLTLGGTINLVLQQPSPTIHTELSVRHAGFTIKARTTAMAFTLPADHRVAVQVAYVDSAGNAATVDGPVTWDTSDAAIAAVEVDGTDSTKATVTAQGVVGNAQVTCSADADLGEGSRPLISMFDVSVVAGEAVAGTITPVGGTEPKNA